MTQHLEALARANEIRLAQAALKRKLRAGEITVEEVFADADPLIASMKIVKLLASQYRWGQIRAGKLLGRLGISDFRRVGDLTPRQKQRIVSILAAKPNHMATFEANDERILAK